VIDRLQLSPLSSELIGGNSRSPAVKTLHGFFSAVCQPLRCVVKRLPGGGGCRRRGAGGSCCRYPRPLPGVGRKGGRCRSVAALAGRPQLRGNSEEAGEGNERSKHNFIKFHFNKLNASRENVTEGERNASWAWLFCCAIINGIRKTGDSLFSHNGQPEIHLVRSNSQ